MKGSRSGDPLSTMNCLPSPPQPTGLIHRGWFSVVVRVHPDLGLVLNSPILGELTTVDSREQNDEKGRPFQIEVRRNGS